MSLRFEEQLAKRIVNVHKHVDGPWFWDRYTAHPYIGCRSGCSFCYLRSPRYLGRRDLADFDQVIGVKTNAPELLRRELARLTPDVIVCGDWQRPAEDRYRLSRAMLEVVRDAAFPLLIVERSPLVVRELDLLVEVGRRAWASVLFSVSNLDPALKRAFEPRSPGVRDRFRAMAALAARGIPVGTAIMPILPEVGDDEGRLDEVVRVVLPGQRQRVAVGRLDRKLALRAVEREAARDHEAAAVIAGGAHGRTWCAPDGSSAPPARGTAWPIGCRAGSAPGPLAINKRVAERLFLRTYDLELEGASSFRVWAYRKAAWLVDELERPLDPVEDLRELPGIGPSIAGEITSTLAAIGKEG